MNKPFNPSNRKCGRCNRPMMISSRGAYCYCEWCTRHAMNDGVLREIRESKQEMEISEMVNSDPLFGVW